MYLNLFQKNTSPTKRSLSSSTEPDELLDVVEEIQLSKIQYRIKGKLHADSENQCEPEEILPLNVIDRGILLLKTELEVVIKLLKQQQKNDIASNAAALYESMRRETEELVAAQKLELRFLRDSCRNKLDETVFKIGEKLVVFAY